MSGNSCTSALQTAPIVSDLRGAPAARALVCGTVVRTARRHPREVGQLVLADLQLVAVLEPVRVDAAAVDVGAVERAEVVEVAVAAARTSSAWSRETVTSSRKTSESGRRPMVMRSRSSAKDSPTRPPPARMTSAAPSGRDLLDLDGHELARLVDPVGRRRRSSPRGLVRAQERAALRAVVRSLRVDEAALRAVDGHARSLLGADPRSGRATGEDVGQLLDVRARDHVLAALVLLAQAVDQLGAQDVDLAVQDAALVGDLELFLGELLDEVLQLLVGERAEIGKRVHAREHTNGSPPRSSSG